MKEEPRTEPAYTGAVLPGSRWRQRAYSGHLEQDVTVLRVGSRSVMVVIEGVGGSKGAPGHERHKVGQKFNVVLETFLRTHTLISQPKGYKPGDEIAPPPKKDAVGTYFKRHRFAQDWLANMGGQDIRAGVIDPALGMPTGPIYPRDEPVRMPMPDPPMAPLTAQDEQKEEPVQTAQAEPEKPKEPEEEVPGWNDAAQAVIDAGQLLPEPVAPAPAPEIDPLDALVDNARAIVAKLDTEVAGKKWERDELAERVAKLDAEIATLSTRRTRATHAVDALVATLLGINEPEPPEQPEPEPAKAQPAPAEPEITLRPSAGGSTRLAGPAGYVPQPGKLSQRQWVLDRFAQKGGLAIQDVVDGFAAEYGISRDRSIKNISSIMHDQMKRPNAQWPTPVRAYPGVYTVTDPLAAARASLASGQG